MSSMSLRNPICAPPHIFKFSQHCVSDSFRTGLADDDPVLVFDRNVTWLMMTLSCSDRNVTWLMMTLSCSLTEKSGWWWPCLALWQKYLADDDPVLLYDRNVWLMMTLSCSLTEMSPGWWWPCLGLWQKCHLADDDPVLLFDRNITWLMMTLSCSLTEISPGVCSL